MSSALSTSPYRSLRLVSFPPCIRHTLSPNHNPDSVQGAITLTTAPATEIDSIFTRENRFEAEKILADLKVPFQINVYGGVAHGFALRADLGVKKNLYAMEDAFKQAVTWFENWL